MPLKPGKSPATVGKNIKAELAARKGKAQAVAIALNTARKSGARIPPPKAKRRVPNNLQDMMQAKS